AVGPYEDNEKNGTWRELWSTGEPWRSVEYVDGKEADSAALACLNKGGQWNADSEKRSLGCQVCRAKPDDTIEPVGTGRWTFWHRNGVIEKQGDLDEGRQVGSWRFNYDNGQKMLEGLFKEGKEVGAWSGWYRGGQLRFRGAYADGEPVGEWTSLYPDGKPLSAGRYDAGQKVGRWTSPREHDRAQDWGDY